MPDTGKQVFDDLEPYRRLIEIQKQLVEMSKEHEQTRRECDALREQVTREMSDSRRWKTGVRQRLRQSASKFLKRLSRITTAQAALRTLNHKHRSYVKGY